MSTDTTSLELKFPQLTGAMSPVEHRLHEDALEWSLAEPIIIESAEDIKSRVNWQDKLEPFHHQIRNLMTFCRKAPVALIADDVGLGKTISAGLILSELMIRGKVTRALVICPSLLGPQWIDELESKFGIFGRWSTGQQLDRELNSESPVVATTYQSASQRLKKIVPGAFDMLIIDEAHRVRNLYGSQKPPQFAQNIRDALESRLFRYVVMLTATPIQNRLWDLYSLIDCLAVAKGHAHPFGTVDQFKRLYIRDSAATARELNPVRQEEFRRILRNYLARTRREDVQLLFPEREVKLFRVKPNQLDQKLQLLVANNIDHANGLVQSSLSIAMMSSPHALQSQLQNMSAKDPHWGDLARQVEGLVRTSGLPTKLQGLLKFIQLLRDQKPKDWRVVVFTTRKETLKLIVETLEEKGVTCGVIKGGQPKANYNTVKDFTGSPPRVHVIVSTDAGAEGVNLQAGNVVVNYDLPWNPMIVEQRIGRVQRLASEHAHVIIVNMAVAGSPEERVVVRLLAKLQTIAHTVGDIESILEATGGDAEKKSEDLKNEIRELVLKSLKGQDTEEATRLITESVQTAKELFEDQRAELDAKLGNLDEIHQTGPSMPRLETLQPSTPYEEFVKTALETEGYRLEVNRAGGLEARKSGHPVETVVFNEREWQQFTQPGQFHGRSAKLYAPGKPAFERLVQRWLERGQHYTRDLTVDSLDLARPLCEQWLDQIPGAVLKDLEIVSRRAFWQGRTAFKTTATNSVDSYETLVDLEYCPDNHQPMYDRDWESGTPLRADRDLERELPELKSAAAETCAQHDQISVFRDFYLARLAEERERAGDDHILRQRLEQDFRPSVFAQAVSHRGLKYETCQVRMSFMIDGQGEYEAELELFPADRQILHDSTKWGTCAESERQVPESCLGTCSISQQKVLRHLLLTSQESGRQALAQHTTRCERTGKIVLSDEYLRSDYSGKQAAASAFDTSPVSDRKGLSEEFTSCEFTNTLVLKDEVKNSEVSQKTYRIDQEQSSAMSNRTGHQSEFVACELTGDIILPEETAQSDVSQIRFRSDRIGKSDRPPYRIGTLQEVELCEETGKQLLADEVTQCAVTGKTVDTELLAVSALSGRQALPAELVRCEVSDSQVLPEETVQSDLSSQIFRQDLALKSEKPPYRTGFEAETVICAVSRKRLLRDEAAECELTSQIVDTDLLERSAVSGKRVLKQEMVLCDETGDYLLPEEAGISDVSGKHYRLDLLRNSERPPHRQGGPAEIVTCESTSLKLLSDEVAECTVTAKIVDQNLLEKCRGTGQLAFKEELVCCEETNQLYLPSEIVTSAVSGKRVGKQLCGQSVISQKWALNSELECCEITNDDVLPEELRISSVSGKKFREDEAIASLDGEAVCHISEGTRDELSEEILHPQDAEVSDFSGKMVSKSKLIASEKSGRKGLVSELEHCEQTGKRLLRDELEKSVVSGKLVVRELLLPSSLSGCLALQEELVTCQASGHRLLPDETVFCADVKGPVNRNLATQSDISGLYGLNSQVCAITGKQGLPGELVRCAATKQYVIPEMTETCSVTGITALKDKLVQSDISERWLVPGKAKRSFVSKRLLCPDEAIFCFWYEGYLAPDEAATCERTGLTFSRKLISHKTKQFKLLSQVVYGEVKCLNFESLIPWLRGQADGKLKSVDLLVGLKSRKGNYLVARARRSRSLGVYEDFLGLIIRRAPEPKVIGRITLEIDKAPGWKEI